MLIVKKGKILRFVCRGCDCEFVVGYHSIKNEGGNFYCSCPMCGTECHTDYAKQPRRVLWEG